jgi:hypothetical protein
LTFLCIEHDRSIAMRRLGGTSVACTCVPPQPQV